MRALVGVILVLTGAISFGLMPLFSSWARGAGASLESMLFLRFAAAGLLLGVWCWARRLAMPRGRTLRGLCALGGAVYVAMTLCYFGALEYGSPGLVTLLLYLYPAIVTLFAWLVLKDRMTPARIGALALAMAGAALALRPEGDVNSMLILLGVGSAVFYSAYILMGERLARDVDPLAASTVVIVSSAVAYGVLAAARGPAWPTTGLGWTGVACLAAVSTVLAISAFFAGLRRIGAVRTSTLSTVEVATAAVVGAAAFGERLSAIQIVGGVMIVGAAVVTAWASKRGGDKTPVRSR